MKSAPGEGNNDKAQRQIRRGSRKKATKRKQVSLVEEERSTKRARGVCVCNEKGPTITGRYCGGEFLDQGRDNQHVKHMFLQGQSARDIALRMWAAPGGATAVGACPDRLGGTSTARPECLVASPSSTPASACSK